MSLADALKNSREIESNVNAAAQGVQFPDSSRARLSAALLDQVYEHHESIQLLLEKKLVGSAFALLRPTFETALRGIWLFRCATDAEVEQFKKDRLDKTLAELISAVEAAVDAPGTALSHVKAKYWNGMCSYTHGGYLQAVRRNSMTDIGPEYSEEEQIGVLSFADACLLLASVSICSLGNREDLAKRIAHMLPTKL
jgi:uncharacterized protein DUF6988